MKIGESVYFYMRIKWHFFKKDRRKAHQKRPTILIFGKRWSILLKARKMNKLSLLLFESLKEMERRGGTRIIPENRIKKSFKVVLRFYEDFA